ncbi:chemotaxis response regulator protein-glutamate methylesterase [Sulfuriflexus sp.]|uniref:protein-glutamate methylesterase/protein-glutamine glutaminase n=1 Tax=Sulfuriflexus sp. TaxID=2015443 RepID=UPI0028CBEB96|nr:chemotaxis response regulator protein-glutamate methylesterase [Sulfuriflexus sp.]MDT8404572.1 chemotaxis response regulator protein-glutamate methylesterase [Sulfuriflexus sp.]
MSSNKIKALIIDDSALVREVLTEILNADPALEVIGTASDPLIARNKIKQLNPDVLTLDVEMPRMDGLTFLSNLMRLRPMPVVMVSSLTENGADITLQALEIGAVDFVSKPKLDIAHGLKEYADELCEKVKMAAGAKLQNYSWDSRPQAEASQRHSADAILDKPTAHANFKTTDKIIAIGASTGGTEAIKEVLMQMPADAPGTVITQHIPEAFSAPFARRMHDNCAMTVYEASDGQQILPGHVYIAPGNRHLMIERSGARYICRLSDGPPVNRHRPAVDVMFRSVAQNVGPNAIGIILTGMGDDGAAGLKEMHDAGARTIAQDERTSVVWGMPGEAVKHGGVDEILPLHAIAPRFMRFLQ